MRNQSKLYFILGSVLWAIAFIFILFESWPKKDQGLGVFYFKTLPVQQNGRIKPLDTIARTALLSFSGKQVLRLENGEKLEPSTWLLIMATQPELADGFSVFRIDHPEVISLVEGDVKKRYYSFNDLVPSFERLQSVIMAIQEEQNLTAYHKAVKNLNAHLTFYHQLIHSFRPFSPMAEDVLMEYKAWEASIQPGINALQAQLQGGTYEAEDLDRFMLLSDRYLKLAREPLLGIVPPIEGGDDLSRWDNVGQALLDSIITGHIHPVVYNYAKLAYAAQMRDADNFGEALDGLRLFLGPVYPEWRLKLEVYLNQLMPFYQSMALYVWAFVVIIVGWLFKNDFFSRMGYGIMGLSFIIHTLGLITRMVLQGRPPVTSLYASALFVGWAGVLISLFIERIYKKGLGVSVGSLVGFCTLLVAHHLGGGEDTLEQVRAVLDANFWLSTHVIMVTLGYSAMFLAGAFGILGTVRSLFHYEELSAVPVGRMIYGTLCFALFFSFIGTLLGGIWADQSWGRFWGWDPKENGALLIVLWGAFILHGRLAGVVQERGLIVGALFGNILTSWSWFGTNMLGVGLHSYGFMEAAFWGLFLFMLTQVLLMGLAFLKLKNK